MKYEFDLALEDINLLLSERIWVNKNDVDADFTAYRVDLAKVKAFYDNNDKYNKKSHIKTFLFLSFSSFFFSSLPYYFIILKQTS